MDEVALAATIGGTVVGLAGVTATAWSSWLQRASSRELAASEHAHERELARGARLFEHRAPVYEQMRRVLQPWMELVDATEPEPLLLFAGESEPPEPPGDEVREMLVLLRTHGSLRVADAFEEVTRAITFFFAQAGVLRQIRAQGGDVREPWQETQAARENVRDKLRALQQLVSEELSAL
jgi:hypothetical protein